MAGTVASVSGTWLCGRTLSGTSTCNHLPAQCPSRMATAQCLVRQSDLQRVTPLLNCHDDRTSSPRPRHHQAVLEARGDTASPGLAQACAPRATHLLWTPVWPLLALHRPRVWPQPCLSFTATDCCTPAACLRAPGCWGLAKEFLNHEEGSERTEGTGPVMSSASKDPTRARLWGQQGN